MSKKAPVTRRRKLPPVVAAIVLPVAKRLARIEALLLEMRHEQDMKLKKLNALEIQVETLTEHVRSFRRTGESANRRKL